MTGLFHQRLPWPLVFQVLGVIAAVAFLIAPDRHAGRRADVVPLLEGKVLVPQLVGRATGLHPLAVMLVLLAGAHLAGLIGALVSVPFLAAVWAIVRVTCADRE